MRRIDRRLVMIVLLAVGLRAAAALYLGDTFGGPQQERIYDQVSYHALAQSLLAGKGYTFEVGWYPFTLPGAPTAHWSFLYPLYLSAIYFVTGMHPLAARLVQAVVSGTLSTLLFFATGKRLFGRTVGYISAGLGAVYAYFIFHDAALMTESFFILCVLGIHALTLEMAGVREPGKTEEAQNQSSRPRGNLGNFILLGLLLGVTTLVRQTILLWAPFLFAWLFLVERRRLAWWKPALSLGILALLVLPWTVRNYIVYHTFLPLNSNAGYALYSANHPDHGIHFDQDYVAPLPVELQDLSLNEAQLNNALTRQGLQFILQDPQRYLLLSLSRVGIFFNFWFSPESSLLSNLMRVLSFGLYLPFFVLGLLLSFRDWRRTSLTVLFTLVFSAIHILTWASVRYRLPVDAALMPFAGLALLTAYQKISGLVKGHITHPSLDTTG